MTGYLDNKKPVIIKGNPASGKSAILRNVGFKLAKQYEEVYIIELKRTLTDLNEVLKLQQGYLLIDDAYINLTYVNEIIMGLSNTNVKILISTRDINDIEEQFGPISTLNILEDIKNGIKINSYDVAEGIIQKFSEIKKKIPDGIKEKLTKNNLLILIWQLKAYEDSISINKNAVYKSIRGYIEKHLSSVELKDLKVKKAENVFLPLSIFYRYELPVRLPFIEKFAESNDIKNLIDLNEINKLEQNGKTYITMHHSEIAKLFLTTFQNCDDFGSEIKEKFEGNWIEGLFHKYLKGYPENNCSLINKIYNNDIDMLKKLIENDNIINYISNGIKDENNAFQIGLCIFNISKFNKNKAEEILKTSLEAIKNIIEKEENLSEIGGCIAYMSKVDNDQTKLLIEMLNPETIKNIIDKKESDLPAIGECIKHISNLNKTKANEIVKRLDLNIFKDKIEEENSFEKIKACIQNTFISNRDKTKGEMLLVEARKLLDLLDPNIMKEKMEKYLINENIPYNIRISNFSLHIHNIIELNNEKAKEVVYKLDSNIIKKTMEKKSYLETPWLISNIHRANPKKAKELIDILDINKLKKKIQWEEYLENICLYIYNLYQANPKKAKELIDILDLDAINNYKIRKEGQIKNISKFIHNIYQINVKKSKYLIKILNLELLKKKIKAENNINTIALLISTISKIDIFKAINILDSVFESIKYKLKNEKDIEKLSWCISDISRIDLTKSEELSNLLDSKSKEKVMEKIKIVIIPKLYETIKEYPKEKEQYLKHITTLETLLLKIKGV